MSLIKAENLTFRYNDVKGDVLKNISFEINEGEFVTILGHNGSGKSTLAKMFSCIIQPTQGTLTIDGMDVSDENNTFNIRKNVGMVFQNPDNQIITSIVEEDVAFALENLGVEYDEMHERVDEALEKVGMSEYKKHMTTRLSGGQKQRVAIAGIIAMRPRILVLDEPTAMLDPQGRREVFNVIKELNNGGITVVMITHFMNEASQSGRCIILNNGEILLDGEPEYVFQNVGLIRSVGLDVPQSVELMFKLRQGGIKVPISVLNDEKCIDVLKDMFDGKIRIGD